MQTAKVFAAQRIDVVDVVLDARQLGDAVSLDVELLDSFQVDPWRRRALDMFLAGTRVRDIARLVFAIIFAAASAKLITMTRAFAMALSSHFVGIFIAPFLVLGADRFRVDSVAFACLAIATNGRIKLRGAIQEHLITFLNAVRRLGGEYEVTEDGIAFWRAQNSDGSKNFLAPLEIRTDVHPGFMTDWQQPLAVLLTQAQGTSTIHETIYEDRFAYVNDLNQMGVNIKISMECPPNDPCRFAGKGLNHFAIIEGANSPATKTMGS